MATSVRNSMAIHSGNQRSDKGVKNKLKCISRMLAVFSEQTGCNDCNGYQKGEGHDKEGGAAFYPF